MFLGIYVILEVIILPTVSCLVLKSKRQRSKKRRTAGIQYPDALFNEPSIPEDSSECQPVAGSAVWLCTGPAELLRQW